MRRHKHKKWDNFCLHIQKAWHDRAIVDSGIESQLKQNECPDQSVPPQSDREFRCPLTESLNNAELIDLHVYTKVPYQIRGGD